MLMSILCIYQDNLERNSEMEIRQERGLAIAESDTIKKNRLG